MRFAYDLTQASTVIKDVPIYIAGSAGVVAGQALVAALDDDSEGQGCAVAGTATTMVDFYGVTNETVADGTSVYATGVRFYSKLIVNPMAVYCNEVDLSTHATATNTEKESIDSTFTATAPDGGWIYLDGASTNAGYGNLLMIGVSTSTTTADNVSSGDYDDELVTPDASATFVMLPCILGGGATGGTVNLITACTKADGKANPTAGADIIILEHYINAPRFPMEPLRVERHCGKNVKSAKFYSDLYFNDHICIGGLD